MRIALPAPKQLARVEFATAATTQKWGELHRFKFLQDGKVNVFYWVDGKFGHALSGSISTTELAHISNAVYEQLALQ